MNRSLVKGNKIQLHMHDGTTILGKKEHAVGDSLYLAEGKISQHVPLVKGTKGLVMKGKYIGQEAKVLAREGDEITVQVGEQKTILSQKQVAVQ
jgi:ribosomal protein S4E